MELYRNLQVVTPYKATVTLVLIDYSHHNEVSNPACGAVGELCVHICKSNGVLSLYRERPIEIQLFSSNIEMLLDR